MTTLSFYTMHLFQIFTNAFQIDHFMDPSVVLARYIKYIYMFKLKFSFKKSFFWQVYVILTYALKAPLPSFFCCKNLSVQTILRTIKTNWI